MTADAVEIMKMGEDNGDNNYGTVRGGGLVMEGVECDGDGRGLRCWYGWKREWQIRCDNGMTGTRHNQASMR